MERTQSREEKWGIVGDGTGVGVGVGIGDGAGVGVGLGWARLGSLTPNPWLRYM